MLTFEMEVSAADVVERTIEGTIVPYGELGTIGGKQYRFRPGSLTLARARTPLLVDHDRGRPIGVLAKLTETEAGALGRFKVDETPEGELALKQAASGSRGSLSVGAEIDDVEELDGVLEVSAARMLEASLLALGAFPSAAVTHVQAELEEHEPAESEESNPDQTELPVEPAPPDPEEYPMPVEASAAPVIIAARDRAPRELSAGELVSVLIRAQHGEPDARRYLEAALTESISTDVTGLLPPTYET